MRFTRLADGKGAEVPSEMGYEEWKREFVTERAGTPEKLSTAEQKVLTNDNENIMLNSRPGKMDTAKVDLEYISSKIYIQKIVGRYNNEIVGERVANCCQTILRNRNGTNFEELFAVDAASGQVLTYIKGKTVNGIEMSDKLKKLLTTAPKSSIIIIHNHPNSSTFSKADISVALKYNSISETVAAGHNGTLYFASGVFGHDNAIRDYTIAYTKYSRLMNDFDARNAAWETVAGNLGFNYERR